MRRNLPLSMNLPFAAALAIIGGCTSNNGTSQGGTPTATGGSGPAGGAVGHSGGAGPASGGSGGGTSGPVGGAGGGGAGGGTTTTPSSFYYQTKTPYRMMQDPATYEAPPAGYSLVYTQLVARHGSRGLSSMKDDLAVYNLWQKASTENALTPLGTKLGPDVLKIMKANFLLGYGVSGISKPGYGNESKLGISEHQQLAKRLLARDAALFTQVGAAATTTPRQIVTVTSGVDRAVDSGKAFVASLLETQPNFTSLVFYPPAPAPYPATTPVAQPAGTDRFLLYFHKLGAATDLVTDMNDPRYKTYTASLAYQAYQNGPDVAAKQAAVLADPAAAAVGRAVMERLFTKSFVDALDAKTFSVANTGTMTYTSDDGAFTNTLVGDGKNVLTSAAEAAVAIYNLYAVAPALTAEAPVDFTQYMPLEQAKFISYTQDAGDYYGKGPGITESTDINWRIAQILLDDFFNEVDAIARGNLGHAAKLRFAHAEIIIPFTEILALKNTTQQTPLASQYSYENNPWRGEDFSPMAANVQWDVLRGTGGTLLVKMFLQEKEIDFKTACDSARVTAGSHYYDYGKLKTCYGHVAAPAAAADAP